MNGCGYTCLTGGVLKSNCVTNLSPKSSSSTGMMPVYTAINVNAFFSISKCFGFSFLVEYLKCYPESFNSTYFTFILN